MPVRGLAGIVIVDTWLVKLFSYPHKNLTVVVCPCGFTTAAKAALPTERFTGLGLFVTMAGRPRDLGVTKESTEECTEPLEFTATTL